MKKTIYNLVSIVLVVVLLASTISASAISTENDNAINLNQSEMANIIISQIAAPNTSQISEGTQIILSGSKVLYSFMDEPIAIYYELSPVGYVIFDTENLRVLEYSTETSGPYEDISTRCYYNGVLNYFYKSEGIFIDISSGLEADIDDCIIFDSQDFYSVPVTKYSAPNNRMANTTTEVLLTRSYRNYNCNVRQNFSFFYPDATSAEIQSMPGVCGSLACAILLAFYDDHLSSLAGGGDFANNSKKVSGSISDKTYGIDLVAEIVNYVEPSGDGSFLLGPGSQQYLASHGISGKIGLNLLESFTEAQNAIGSDGSGVPIIVGTQGHYQVVVGYRIVTSPGIVLKYLKVVDGSERWINNDTVISSWSLQI